MKISGSGLVCAATFEELQAFGLENAETLEPETFWRIPEGYAAVTGVGIPIALMRLIPWMEALKPTRIFNLGIAGAYPESGLNIGDVVVGASEVFADLGMETPDATGFLPLSEFPFADEALRTPMDLWIPEWAAKAGIKQGHSATVNRCTGKDGTGWLRRKFFGVDFESMEGAAVALAARPSGIPVCEIRAISNVAARRNMRPENIQAALKSLRDFWLAHRKNLA